MLVRVTQPPDLALGEADELAGLAHHSALRDPANDVKWVRLLGATLAWR
ncbi:MAG TPA: hypothetical protein VMK12_18640 [Anaeromyxobacteraceae bacterium]|nr:hypothetical protein [Anaeromyxobacteraceae bacterium]